MNISGYEFDAEYRNRDVDMPLIVYAVNRLPLYEKVVEAADTLLDLAIEFDDGIDPELSAAIDEARAALNELRGAE